MELLKRCCCCCGDGGQSQDGALLSSGGAGYAALSTRKKNQAGTIEVGGATLSGAGTVLADEHVLQDRAYWEVSIERADRLEAGVASDSHILGSALGDGRTSWALHSTELPRPLATGDVLGVALDQADYPVKIKFTLNGEPVASISGPATECTPIFRLFATSDSVSVNFGDAGPFAHAPGGGFSGLMRSRSIL